MRHIGNSGLSPFELYECLVLLVKHRIQISMNWKTKRGRTWYSLHANCNQLCVYFKAISVDMVGIISNKQKPEMKIFGKLKTTIMTSFPRFYNSVAF